MQYDVKSPDMPKALGMSDERIQELEDGFLKVLQNLPEMFKVYHIHQGAASLIDTVEDAYYLGNLVREYINTLETMPMQKALEN